VILEKRLLRILYVGIPVLRERRTRRRTLIEHPLPTFLSNIFNNMKPSTALSLVLSLLPLASAVPAPAAATGASLAESENQFEALVQQATDATLDSIDPEGTLVVDKRTNAKCTSKNISIRRELYVLLLIFCSIYVTNHLQRLTL